MKATPGRAAEPVLRLPRLSRPGDVALSPACGCSFRPWPVGDELAGAGKACAANSSLAEPPRCTPGWIRTFVAPTVCTAGGWGARNLPLSAGFRSPSAGAAAGVGPEQECGVSHLTLEENAPIVGHV